MKDFEKIPQSILLKDKHLTIFGALFVIFVTYSLLEKGYLPNPEFIKDFIDYKK